MIFLDFYKNKCVGVIGLGKTGNSVVEALSVAGAHVIPYDDSLTENPKSSKLSDFDWKNLDALVVSPGIHLLWPDIHPAVQLAREYSVPIVNDVDLFRQHAKGKSVCITGTNGKSTTTALIGHILKAVYEKTSIGGNIGKPILSLEPNSDFYVLELSSYQLESCNILRFDTAVLLNITPDHLTRHGGMSGYASAKQKIFAGFHKKSRAVVGIDDAYCARVFEFLKCINHPNIIPVSGEQVPEFGVGWDNGKLIDNRFGDSEFICEKNPVLDGLHNRQNIAAAYAACVTNGVDRKSFCDRLFSFKGLEHRQEYVDIIDGVEYINDSKATNADSVEQALRRFDDIVWILGGRPKEDGIDSLIKYFQKIKFALLIGEAAEEWSKLLSENGVKNEISKTLDVAVLRAAELSKKTNAKIVLLSPACASFDQFKSFEERGDEFKKLVFGLKQHD